MGKTVNPVWVSGHYRFYQDDAGLGAATAYAAQDTSATVNTDTTFRLRLNWGESANQTAGTSIAPYLQYRINSGSWVTVGAATAVLYTSSSQSITDGDDDTADRITTAPTGCASSSGTQEFDDNNATTARTYDDSYGEIEFCLQLDGASVSNSDVVDFQIVYSGDTALDSYDTTPSLTAAGLTHYQLDVNSGSVSVTGSSVDLLFDRDLTVSSGSVSVSGSNVSLFAGRQLDVSSGAVSVAGSSISLTLDRKLNVSSGSFTVTGSDVDLAYDAGLTHYQLDVNPGSINVSGSSISLDKGYRLDVGSGSIAVTGSGVDLSTDRRLEVNTGSVSVSGSSVDLLYNRTLDVNTGSVSVTGADVSLQRGQTLSVSSGSLAITGSDVSLVYDRMMNVTTGSINVTGSDVNLVYSGGIAQIAKINGIPTANIMYVG